jgi:hypothetical protein
MIPTFTLSKNDLAYLLFRTATILSLRRPRAGIVNVSFSYPLLMIGEHKWWHMKGMKAFPKTRFTVHEHHGMALGCWSLWLAIGLQCVTGLHAGDFFCRASFVSGT